VRLKKILAFTLGLIFIFLSLSLFINLRKSEPEANAQTPRAEVSTTSGNSLAATQNPVPVSMVRVVENDYLELYLNQETAAVAVIDKDTGAIWHTNPEGRNEDPLASGHVRNLLNSQIAISYHTLTGQLLHMNSYFDSVRHGQFEVINIANGIRITYRIGREERIFVVPRAISVERMEQMILNNLPEDRHRALLRNYRLIILDEIADESRRSNLLEQHPSLEEIDLYLLAENIAPFMKEQLEELILEAGYTIDDMNEDHVLHNVPVVEPRRDIFTIPLEYTLDGKNLVVRIPTEEVIYHEEYPLLSIRLLEFFGAANTEQEGYIFVPDASGALINLNNNKQHFQPFSAQIYGRDHSIPLAELTEITEQAYLPVYGLAKGNRAFFTIIEHGDALATVRADVSGRMNSFNSVFSEFTTVAADVLDVGALSGLNVIHVHQPRIFIGDIQLRFSFLYGENATYVGMAHLYQEYLVNRYDLERLDAKEGIPMFVNVIGAVNIRRPFLGMPVNRIMPLTTYDQTIEILQSFKAEGINNLNLRFSGWFNGGVRHTLPMRLNHIGAIGGRGGFQRLLDYTSENAIPFFPDVGLTFVYADRLFDGFNPRDHASRLLSRPIARLQGFNIATLDNDADMPMKHVLSPAVMPRVIDSVITGFNNLNIQSIGLRDAGFNVNADFRENALIDRQQASEILSDSVRSLKDAGLDILISGGNANVLPFADALIDMPMNSNQYDIVDHCVPFFQIVLRGFIEFAGTPINSVGNTRIELLRAIETGAGLHNRFIYNDNTILKRTDYDDLLSVNFGDWFDVAVEKYNFVNDVTGNTQGERIIGHNIIEPGVHKTTFENGKQIIVNYSRYTVIYEGKTIEGENFLVLREGN